MVSVDSVKLSWEVMVFLKNCEFEKTHEVINRKTWLPLIKPT